MHGSLNEKVKNAEFVTSVFKSDIVLLSETWSNEYSDINVNGYTRVSKIRKLKKKAKRSSGGLEVYIKDNLIKGITNLNWEFEDGLSFKFDNDFFGWEKPLYLFFTYFKPKNSTRSDLDNEDDCYNNLLNHISTVVEDGTILVTGDLNSRVSNLQECPLDVTDNVNISDVFNVPLHDNSFNSFDFIDNNMSVIRSNKDTHTNDYGYKLVEFCTSCDLAILNGRAGNDKGQGQTTFCGPKGESTVDFVLCDKYTLYNVKDFNISDHVPFSDHKILNFTLKSFIDLNTDGDTCNVNVDKLPFSYTRWDENKKENYLDCLQSNDTILKINELSKKLTDTCNKNTLDAVIDDFYDILTNAGSDHIHTFFSNTSKKKQVNFGMMKTVNLKELNF